MTRAQYREEETKAKARVLNFIKSKGWKQVTSVTYGIGIHDPRCEFSYVRVICYARSNSVGFQRDPTGIRVKIEGGPVRTLSYNANTTDQLSWDKIEERIVRAVEAATAEMLKRQQEDKERRQLILRANAECVVPPYLVDKLERKLQTDGTYKVMFRDVISREQVMLLVGLLSVWEDDGTTEMLTKLITNIQKREAKGT